MRLWIVEKVWDWEGAEVIGVFDNPDDLSRAVGPVVKDRQPEFSGNVIMYDMYLSGEFISYIKITESDANYFNMHGLGHS
jgi:hypothetical protein